MLQKVIESRLRRGVQRAGGLCYKFTSPGCIGVPDRIIIMPPGRIVFVELKTETGRRSPRQTYIQSTMREAGAEVYTVYGPQQVDELVRALAEGRKPSGIQST